MPSQKGRVVEAGTWTSCRRAAPRTRALLAAVPIGACRPPANTLRFHHCGMIRARGQARIDCERGARSTRSLFGGPARARVAGLQSRTRAGASRRSFEAALDATSLRRSRHDRGRGRTSRHAARAPRSRSAPASATRRSATRFFPKACAFATASLSCAGGRARGLDATRPRGDAPRNVERFATSARVLTPACRCAEIEVGFPPTASGSRRRSVHDPPGALARRAVRHLGLRSAPGRELPRVVRAQKLRAGPRGSLEVPRPRRGRVRRRPALSSCLVGGGSCLDGLRGARRTGGGGGRTRSRTLRLGAVWIKPAIRGFRVGSNGEGECVVTPPVPFVSRRTEARRAAYARA